MQSIPVWQLPFPLFSQILLNQLCTSASLVSQQQKKNQKNPHNVTLKTIAGIYCASAQTVGTLAPRNWPLVSLDFNALHTL